MEAQRVSFVGGGRIARILLGGWSQAGMMPRSVTVHDPNVDVLAVLQSLHPGVAVVPLLDAAAAKDLLFLAVHPPQVIETMRQIADQITGETVVISLAPKITIARIQEILGTDRRAIRIIPNAASIIGKGYNPLFFSSNFADCDKKDLLHFFSVWGDCPEVPEHDLESYAILTAMGPTYFWPQFYELKLLGVSFGLSAAATAEGIEKMIAGTLATMADADLSPEQLQDLVPIKPMAAEQAAIVQAYRQKLTGLMAKLRA